MNALKFFLSVLALVITCAFPVRAQEGHEGQAPDKAQLPVQSLYNLTSVWEDQNGKKINLASLRGQPVIAAMAYTSCKEMCPLIVHHMMEIEDDISSSGNTPVRFVLFSFDAERDTPDRLRSFAEEHDLDLSHWTLLHGDKKAVQEMAAALGVRYRQRKSGDFDHSNIISLLNANGVVVAQQVGLDNSSQNLEQKLKGLWPQ